MFTYKFSSAISIDNDGLSEIIHKIQVYYNVDCSIILIAEFMFILPENDMAKKLILSIDYICNKQYSLVCNPIREYIKLKHNTAILRSNLTPTIYDNEALSAKFIVIREDYMEFLHGLRKCLSDSLKHYETRKSLTIEFVPAIIPEENYVNNQTEFNLEQVYESTVIQIDDIQQIRDIQNNNTQNNDIQNNDILDAKICIVKYALPDGEVGEFQLVFNSIGEIHNLVLLVNSIIKGKEPVYICDKYFGVGGSTPTLYIMDQYTNRKYSISNIENLKHFKKLLLNLE